MEDLVGILLKVWFSDVVVAADVKKAFSIIGLNRYRNLTS